MPGILQLNQGAGNSAQGLLDQTGEQTADRQIANIGAKSANKQELGYFVGRGVNSGITTAKDYFKYSKAKGAGASPQELANLPGVGEDGSFHPLDDFAMNFANPYAKYANLNKVMRTNHSAYQTPSQPGNITTLDGYNSPMVGNIFNAYGSGN